MAPAKSAGLGAYVITEMNIVEKLIVGAARWRHANVEMEPGPVLSATIWVMTEAACKEQNETLSRELPKLVDLLRAS